MGAARKEEYVSKSLGSSEVAIEINFFSKLSANTIKCDSFIGPRLNFSSASACVRNTGIIHLGDPRKSDRWLYFIAAFIWEPAK